MINHYKQAILFAALLTTVLTGCEPEEIPVDPHKQGNIMVRQVEMMPDYRYQLFYDLGRDSVVSRNQKTDWDIALETGAEGWHIILNTARGGAAAPAGTGDFTTATGIENANWRWDGHTGDLDSTAIGDYRHTQEVYFIDRGYDPAGNHTGYRKMVVQEVNETGYTIRVAHPDNTGDTTVHITKDSTFNFMSFSFATNSVVPIEPPKTDWDLVFTQYTHVFNVPPGPYLVTGVLLNRHNVQVANDDQKAFSAITYGDIDSYQFSKALNTIGYEWKTYSFDDGSYSVDASVNYIIQDTEGRYYKLHFIDFYNQSGEKGAPRFEMQLL